MKNLKQMLMVVAITTSLVLGMPTFARGGCHCSHSSFHGSYHSSGISSSHISSFRTSRGIGVHETHSYSTHYARPTHVYIHHENNNGGGMDFWHGYMLYSMFNHHNNTPVALTPQQKYTQCIQYGGGSGCKKYKGDF